MAKGKKAIYAAILENVRMLPVEVVEISARTVDSVSP
ncbi:MAG: hypothetical protein BMS9Abin05_1858 [Rhodothermia bacterium]|nr:MAG: hypothetical protein BMS9Abin05_1858 [Rhodothermia bacterium]